MQSSYKRLAIFGLIAGFSLLLLGAGKVTGGIFEGLDERQMEKQQLTAVVLKMLPQIPQQHHEQWKKAAAENPELLLRVNTTDFGFRPTR